MDRRQLRSAFAVAAILAAGPAVAQEGPEVSFNVGVATDYVFRGVSQTDEDPQVFGGVDATAGQFYVGAWASNVDYGDGTDLEYDLYAGYTPTIGAVSLDFGVYFFGYVDAPTGADYDYVELQATASLPLGPATLGAGVYHAPDSYGGVDHSTYVEINGAYSPRDNISFSAALGRQTFDGPGDYTTWNIGVGYRLTETLGLDLRYHDTDRHRFGETYGSRVAASLTATF
ncbi:TorF family putative porin [Phenylobacterium kunshanense]|uniref:Porin n=1 Tax=Phenylobacterium kunshanense TaxID=1445034 RepID=A0A328B9C1_9CAUL|nr:TorF family putative porin [Phenylobacterium kunshanense]RAK63031.1 hypothetical protein DJ019_17310 [Phenylobacterium kunshanense]